jgi:hypothetical protein
LRRSFAAVAASVACLRIAAYWKEQSMRQQQEAIDKAQKEITSTRYRVVAGTGLPDDNLVAVGNDMSSIGPRRCW